MTHKIYPAQVIPVNRMGFVENNVGFVSAAGGPGDLSFSHAP
jgi:hypothetical protein